MIWKIEEAQQQFSEIIKASGATPQVIYQSDHPFVAVIRADLFQEFLKWQQKQQSTSLAEAFEELHQICIEENYTFEIPTRSDRPNPFMESLA
jgi:predicted house-cleaning noncanonical NTP pyrophosphatase (MazG superfamily)